jgi:hypothetical protein
MSKAEIEDSYKISRRIEGEERGLDYATMVFTSTQQEVTADLMFPSGFWVVWSSPPPSRRRLQCLCCPSSVADGSCAGMWRQAVVGRWQLEVQRCGMLRWQLLVGGSTLAVLENRQQHQAVIRAQKGGQGAIDCGLFNPLGPHHTGGGAVGTVRRVRPQAGEGAAPPPHRPPHAHHERHPPGPGLLQPQGTL